MPLRNTQDHYGAVAQTLHWLIVLLIIVQLVLGFTAHGLPISMQRLVLLARHKSVGMSILALALLRLGWRWYSPSPPLPAEIAGWQKSLARGTHALLYALLLALPVVGWISSSASHLTVTWFGLFEFPNLVGPDVALAKLSKSVHMTLAWLLLVIASVHALAAFWHHLVLKDHVLLRMLPWRSTASPTKD
jgi:cytochrome b561